MAIGMRFIMNFMLESDEMSMCLCQKTDEQQSAYCREGSRGLTEKGDKSRIEPG